MIDITAILKGWDNYLFSDPEMEVKAKERAKICAQCPHAVVGSYQQFMPDYTLQEVEGMKCDVCGCPLSTLLRQDDKKCELKKWE